MPRLAVAALLSLLGCQPLLAQQPEPAERRPFARIVERDDGGQLDILVATYQKGDTELTLFAAVHIADVELYREMHRRFAACDVLLYELIADADLRPYPGMRTEDDWFNAFQGGMGRGLGLVHQGDHIDYRKPNFVHADMTGEEWEAALERAGSSLIGQLLSGNKGKEPDREAEAKQRPVDLVAAFRSGRGVHELRIAGARLLLDSDGEHREPNVLIEGRNEKCLAVLARQLAAGKKRIGIYYGAAHMEHMERRLQQDLGWRRTGEEWVMAWDNRASRFPTVEKGLQQKRYRARQDLDALTQLLGSWLSTNAAGEPTWAALRAAAAGGVLPGRADGKDPWGRDYLLQRQDGGHLVRCRGSDGAPDTEDDLLGEVVRR